MPSASCRPSAHRLRGASQRLLPHAHGLSIQLYNADGYNSVSLGSQTESSTAQSRLGDEPPPPPPDHSGAILAAALGTILAAHIALALRHRGRPLA